MIHLYVIQQLDEMGYVNHVLLMTVHLDVELLFVVIDLLIQMEYFDENLTMNSVMSEGTFQMVLNVPMMT